MEVQALLDLLDDAMSRWGRALARDPDRAAEIARLWDEIPGAR